MPTPSPTATAAVAMFADQVTPLATSAVDRPTRDEEPKTPPLSSRLLRHRCLICCGAFTALVAVIALVLVIIALTVYKVKDPVMTMNSISIEKLNVSMGSSLLAVNLTVVADASVENPNAVSFRFGKSTTAIYYREREMGVAYGPPGIVGAHKTFRVNATVDVVADRLLTDPNLMSDLASGKVDVSTSTRVGGRVKIFLIFKHHVDVAMNCSVTVAVFNQSILGQSCNQRVWL